MPTLDIGTFFGPCLMFCCISLMLYGAICTQGFAYWTKRKDDSSMLRYTVLFIFLLESLHTAMLLQFIYHYFIIMACNVAGLDAVVWSSGGLIIDAVCIIALAQGFYIFRIYQLSKGNRYLTSALSVSLVIRIGFAFATAILVARSSSWTSVHKSRTVHIILSLGLILNAIVDAILMSLFTLYLHKCRTDFKNTQHVVNKLISYTINTGALAIVASFMVVIMFLTSQTLMFAGMYTVVSKLYANSMLAHLNARGRTQDGISGSVHRNPWGNVEMGIRLDAVGQKSLSHEDSSISDKGVLGR